MFLSLDGTSIVQLVNFAIFFALLNVLFLRPVGAAIKKRREYLDSLVENYDSYQGQANALRAGAEKIRADARREGEFVLAKSRADASNETAKIATEFSAKVQSTVEEAQRRADHVLQQARTDEEQLVNELADLMLERATGEAMAS